MIPSVSLLYFKLILSDSFYCKYILGVVLSLPGTSLPLRPWMATVTLAKSKWFSCYTWSFVSLLCLEPLSALSASPSFLRHSKPLDFLHVICGSLTPRSFAGVILSLRMLLFLSQPSQVAVTETP